MNESRRRFLKLTAAGVVGSSLTGSVAADHSEQKPEHVTISYNERILNKFRPELFIPETEKPKFLGMYGHYATSTEFDYGVCVYWSKYSHQEGWLGNLDSHYGDHEPCYVFFNETTEEVEQIVCSVYHWIAGRARPTGSALNDTHVRLRAIKPWHQYTASTESGELYEIKDLTADDAFQTWLNEGLHESLEPGLVYNPWRMLARGDWWRRSEYTGISFNQMLVSATKSAGIGEVGTLAW